MDKTDRKTNGISATINSQTEHSTTEHLHNQVKQLKH